MTVFRPPYRFSLIVQRSSWEKGFTERENAMMEILNPHIDHFLSIREKLDLIPRGTRATPEDIRGG
jgi:hypothetical protein